MGGCRRPRRWHLTGVGDSLKNPSPSPVPTLPMRDSSRTRWLAAALLLTAAACSDDDPAGPTGDLTATEASELAGIVAQLGVQQGFSAAGSSTASAPAGGPLAAPIAFENTSEFSTGCPQGGTVAIQATISGTVDNETGAIDSDLAVVQTHSSCQVSGGQTGTVYTLDGAPDLAISMTVTTSPQAGTFNVTGAFDGAVSWAADGRSGTCTMDLDVTSTGNTLSASGSNTVSGSVCGIAVSSTIGF